MLYVNDEYVPSNYKYLVDYSNNYVVLSRYSSVNGDYMSPDTIDVKIQYFSPCTQVIDSTYTSYTQKDFPNISSNITNDLKYSKDYIPCLQISIIIVLCLLLIFNGFTRLIKRGGVVFSK